ncbi:MAG: M23 family metallopeptidase [Pseudomonadota bacterium]
MKQRLSDRVHSWLHRTFPEQRLFLKSDAGTRFVRLRPGTQILALLGGATVLGWTLVVTSFYLIDAISSGNARDQIFRAQTAYEARVAELSYERDARAVEAEQALDRFYVALAEVSKMQETLLAAEQRSRELETGIEVIQRTLRRTVAERDEARSQMAEMTAKLEDAPAAAAQMERRASDAEATAAALASVLDQTAQSRDAALVVADGADAEIARMEAMITLAAERNDRIFTRLEEAVEVSLDPLKKVFAQSGISTDAILETVRRGYSGTGGPLEPVTFSTRGSDPALPDLDTIRANNILDRLEEVDMYRIAAESMPLAHPVPGPHRRTSGFGPRWGRMHSGLDFAGARGARIDATAEGTVTHAGWQSGYGKLVKIRHPMGFETRYAHLSKIRVTVGQRVSRGQHIGDMGTTGRSTGVHLHYEVRREGRALNPSPFIQAGNDVF